MPPVGKIVVTFEPIMGFFRQDLECPKDMQDNLLYDFLKAVNGAAVPQLFSDFLHNMTGFLLKFRLFMSKLQI